MQTNDKPLKARHKLFVNTYLANGFNASAAYAIAYPKCNKNALPACASRLLTTDNVASLVKEALHTQELVEKASVANIIAELQKIAFADSSDIVSWDNGIPILKNSAALSKDVTSTITDITITDVRGGGQKLAIKRADKLKALELLSKYNGMLTDNVKLSGSVDVNLSMADIAKLADTTDPPTP